MRNLVLDDQVQLIAKLSDALMHWYYLSLWDIPGLLYFRFAGEELGCVAPPLVERYTETARPNHPLLNGLVDGMHRVTAARAKGFESIRMIVISGTPYPLVPLPVKWEDVHTYPAGQRPGNLTQKRDFRFGKREDLPFGAFHTENKRPEEPEYFFYRRLDDLGSPGMREIDGRFAHERER